MEVVSSSAACILGLLDSRCSDISHSVLFLMYLNFYLLFREAMAEAKVDTAVAVMVEAREVMEAGVINSSFSLNICTNKQKVFLSLSSSNFHI